MKINSLIQLAFEVILDTFRSIPEFELWKVRKGMFSSIARLLYFIVY